MKEVAAMSNPTTMFDTATGTLVIIRQVDATVLLSLDGAPFALTAADASKLATELSNAACGASRSRRAARLENAMGSRRCSICKLGLVIETVKFCGGHAFPIRLDVTHKIREAYEASVGAWHTWECYDANRSGDGCSCGLRTAQRLLREVLDSCDEGNGDG
jgi:hypothetical protein